ncbi:hypothetical protein BW727_100278 [Jeotgalibaca dankookensis]|uniref:Uncharacterized protein n=1 Tax=Jeotgalibaca dankookensis TaxID=708126 RepID=A0A1S6IMC9_9LACT|nr:hypothetical protein BW727_100278 [Jeotgalibaca dankookensis]
MAKKPLEMAKKERFDRFGKRLYFFVKVKKKTLS